jgi:hypothetical protein
MLPETRRVSASCARFGLCLLLTGGLLFASSSAPAQGESKAAATAAFDEAQRLLGEGKVAEACLKFGESHRLDPQLGALLNLADCLERNGQTASAWAAFREAAELAQQRRDPRQRDAEERGQALMGRLSKLQINVPPGMDPSSLHVVRGEVVVGRALFGTPTPTDPGPHQITVSASGYRPWRTTALVRADGSTTVIEVPELEKERPASPETSITPKEPKQTTRTRPAGAASAGVWPPRWAALTAGGVGVAGIALGTIFGLRSKAKRDESADYCDGNLCSEPRGVTLGDEAITAGNVSTVAFIVGGVGLAGGATLWILGNRRPSSSKADTAINMGVGPGQVVMQGSF